MPFSFRKLLCLNDNSTGKVFEHLVDYTNVIFTVTVFFFRWKLSAFDLGFLSRRSIRVARTDWILGRRTSWGSCQITVFKRFSQEISPDM